MSELRFDTKVMPGAPLGPDNPLPGMRYQPSGLSTTELQEEDPLFLNYGLLGSALPHNMQDLYPEELQELHFQAAVLENRYLRAEFLPELGGRLWSLFDKQAGRELLINNPVFRPRNLAIRNAWVAGGIEWNIGQRGHDVLTCSPLFCAHTTCGDGTPVLRFYEYQRVRGVVYQMDFFLPDDSPYLLSRVRLVNLQADVVPMYWWSNVALEEVPGQRVVVPAAASFTSSYLGEGRHAMCKVPLPMASGDFDATYPDRHWNAKDHFFDIAAGERKFEAAIRPDGLGFVHASTDRLSGRKLFVWGQCPGGRQWQRRLTAEGAPPYLEIQAGLCKTQMECLPMPPRGVWEWVEAFGALNVDYGKVAGSWEGAVTAVSAALECRLPRRLLDEWLQRGKDDFVFRRGTLVQSGSGWGALEEQRRGEPLAAHLDFGLCGKEQQGWLALGRDGVLPETDPCLPPPSYMVQEEWFQALRRSLRRPGGRHWHSALQMAINLYFRGDLERAEEYAELSQELSGNVWALFALGHIARRRQDQTRAAEALLLALRCAPGLLPLALEGLLIMLEAKAYDALIEGYLLLTPELQAYPKLQMYYAFALLHTGRPLEAEEVLLRDGGLQVVDIREGENSLSDLYVRIQVAKGELENRVVNPDEVAVPEVFDFRMSVRRSPEGDAGAACKKGGAR